MKELVTPLFVDDKQVTLTNNIRTLLIYSKDISEVVGIIQEQERLANRSILRLTKEVDIKPIKDLLLNVDRDHIVIIPNIAELDEESYSFVIDLINNNHIYNCYIVAGTTSIKEDKPVHKGFSAILTIFIDEDTSYTLLDNPFACINIRYDRGILQCKQAGIEGKVVRIDRYKEVSTND